MRRVDVSVDLTMDLGKQTLEKSGLLRRTSLIVNGFVIGIFFYHGASWAQNWQLTPYVQLEEIYSDNINLTGKDKQKSALVTALNPGANIIWQVGKSNLNLRYNMQNLYNAEGNDAITTNHQLQFNAHKVLVQNRLFLDARSSISQQNISNTRLTADNISGGNRTTISTVGVSPTWMPRFGHYANGIVRINADKVSSEGQNSLFSDAFNLSEMLQFTSGTEFKRFSWSVGFNNSDSYRNSGSDISSRNVNATVRTYIDKHFSVFTTFGHSSNDFGLPANVQANNLPTNGFFYTFGGRWMPSRHYWLEVGGGNNSYATVNIAPTQRFNWLTTVRHNSIGLNSGTTWQTALNYSTRRSRWSLTHSNDTITDQELFAQLSDANSGSTSQGGSTRTPSLTNDVMVRKIWNLSASYYSGKSSITLNAFNEDRTFLRQLITGIPGLNASFETTERVKGINALWNWQFAKRTNAYLRPQWQQIHRTNPKSDQTNYSIAVGLNYLLTSHLNSSLEFRHVDQTSSSDLLGDNFQENRATANLFMRF